MILTRLFDWLFISQLFRTEERGATIFYPNGLLARGYLVPHGREASLRSEVRRLSLASLIGGLALVVFVPRLLEWWLGFTLPLGWFIGGALVALVIIYSAIFRALSRLTAGLEPAS